MIYSLNGVEQGCYSLKGIAFKKVTFLILSFWQDLRDALNYGLYLPPMNGRAGKFLEEERLLKEYPLQGPIGFLEVSVHYHGVECILEAGSKNCV